MASAMTDSWLPDLAVASGAKYQAIADALAAAIAKGELRQGDRIPPQREVANRLGVDLTTVTKAYDAATANTDPCFPDIGQSLQAIVIGAGCNYIAIMFFRRIKIVVISI